MSSARSSRSPGPPDPGRSPGPDPAGRASWIPAAPACGEYQPDIALPSSADQGRADPALDGEKALGVHIKRAPGAAQWHVDDLLDSGRPPPHDRDPVPEQDRLLDVVGDEDDRDPVPLPHGQQELMHA